MISPIVMVLALFVLQTLLPASIRYLLAGSGARERIASALGPRDQQPPMPPIGGRAERALANMQEAMPVFVVVALLHAMRPVADPSAVRGAWVFFAARTLYVPAYLAGVPGVRSLVWIGSWVGLAMLIVQLHPFG